MKSPCCRIGTRSNGCSARCLGEPISGSRLLKVYGTSLCVSTSCAMCTKLLCGNPKSVISAIGCLHCDGFFGGGQHLVGRHVEELRLLLDEALDQPRAGDAVDLGAFARDPFHDFSPSLCGSVGSPSARQAPMPPATATASMPRSRNFCAQSPPISKPQAQ